MQWRAIKLCRVWFENFYKTEPEQRKPFFYLAGFAGTGKTEIAKFIIAELGLTNVIGACFTGKAAHVLSTRGFPNTSTIHSLIYSPVQKGKGGIPQLEEQLKQLRAENAPPAMIERLEQQIHREIQGLRKMSWNLKIDSPLREAEALLVDEVSMVDEFIGSDLISFGKPIIVLGDPGQLPPVKGTGYFTSFDPDFLLSEIHRNAKDSAVIRMATMAREDGYVPVGVYQDPSGFDSVVSYKSDVEKMLWVNQILVGRNATRHRANQYWRQEKGFKGPLPNMGERIIGLKNNREIGIMNGAFYTMTADAEIITEDKCLIRATSDDFPERDVMECVAHSILFGGDPAKIMPWDLEDACSFDFGPAITVHKSQGSQFPHVMLNCEWGDRDTFRKWYYTGLTRAQISNYVVTPG